VGFGQGQAGDERLSRQNSVAGNDQGYQWVAGAKWQIDFCSGISRQELLLKNNSSLTEKWRKK